MSKVFVITCTEPGWDEGESDSFKILAVCGTQKLADWTEKYLQKQCSCFRSDNTHWLTPNRGSHNVVEVDYFG